LGYDGRQGGRTFCLARAKNRNGGFGRTWGGAQIAQQISVGFKRPFERVADFRIFQGKGEKMRTAGGERLNF